MATNRQSMERAGRTRRRYWRRLRDPLDEWWPKGWLLLAALFVLFFVGTFVRAPVIEQDVRAAVVAALTEAGFEVASASASGRRVAVRLSGVPDPQRALAQARAVARGAECATWFGPLVCPTRIQLTQVPVEREPEAAAAGPDHLVAPRYHDLILVRDRDRLQISGEVESEASKLWVLARARASYPATEEALTVSGAAATPMYRLAVERALALLAPLESGTVRWQQGRLALEGLGLPEHLAAARAAYRAVEPALRPLPLKLGTGKTRDRCAGELATLLAAASIGFASASADITPASAGLLDELADLAAECPGRLTVEGHTDDSGAESANLALSRRRAEAVRSALINRGIDADRLRAEGFGETQPIADNATPEGRASNRRIVVRFNG